MFLNKVKAGQVAAGLMVAALLVVAGVNVTGLMKGEETLKKAEARYLKVDFGGGQPGAEGCPGPRFNCIHIGWGGAPGQGVALSVDGL